MGQTFLSASWGNFPVALRPDWKVRPPWERGRPVRNRGRRPRGHWSGLRPLQGGRDARAPSVAASQTRLVSSQCVATTKRLFGYGICQQRGHSNPKAVRMTGKSNLQRPDWKGRPTGRLESPPHVVCCRIAAASTSELRLINEDVCSSKRQIRVSRTSAASLRRHVGIHSSP